MDLAENEQGSSEVDLSNRSCVKCHVPAQFPGVDPKKAAYCQECFIHMVRNKFRSALSKKKIFRDVDSRQTLVLYDGTQSSAFLLHQVNDALRQISFKRLMIEPTILVMVTVSDPESLEKVRTHVDYLKSVLPDSVKWTMAHLAYGLFSVEVPDSNILGIEKIDELVSITSSFKSASSEEEFKRLLKELCIYKVGQKLGIDKVLLSDDADDLGVQVLSQFSLGRGSCVSSLTAITSKRNKFTFIRPLRDISKYEVGIVNNLCSYQSAALGLKFEMYTQNSLQKLTSTFVEILKSEGFKSTTNTIMSTASKIHGPDEGSINKCPMCCLKSKDENSAICSVCLVLLESNPFSEKIVNLFSFVDFS